MGKNTFLKTHTFGDLIKWMGYSNLENGLRDIIGTNDLNEFNRAKVYLNKSLLSMTNLVFFDSIKEMVNDFYEDMQMSKLSTVTLPLPNPITEELESYVLDYNGKDFIILEPREAEAPSKEFELRLDESAFIDYLKEKGEDPFTAQEIVDSLKEEKKMASLLKVSGVLDKVNQYNIQQLTEIGNAIEHVAYELNRAISELDDSLLAKRETVPLDKFDQPVAPDVRAAENVENLVSDLKTNIKNLENFIGIKLVGSADEETKMASLLKLAKNDDISFDTKADLRIWIDLSDIEYDDKIQEIKNMTITIEEKIRLAKERAKELAIDNLNRLWSKNNIYVNQYTPLEETFDRIDWIALLEEKE